MKTPHNPLPAAKACFAANLNEALRVRGIAPDAKYIARKLVLGKWLWPQTDKVQNWLDGKELPVLINFEKLAEWLKCEKDDLLPECYQHLLKG